MKILLVYYHPVIWDLAETFWNLKFDVTVAVNEGISDNYGSGASIIQSRRDLISSHPMYRIIPLTQAIAGIAKKEFELVGCDGKFSGDEKVIQFCQSKGIPFFCVNGYPYNIDEPSNNILSFSWWLPQVQYLQKFPSEGHVKQQDWQEIAKSGKSAGKNICVFYPQFWNIRNHPVLENPDGIWVSAIQKYRQFNLFSFDVFEQVGKHFQVQNVEGKSHQEWLSVLADAKGFIHLKWADCPGVSLIEAMLFGKPVATMRSFLLASFNQELLIDGHSAIVADSFDELIDRMQNESYDHFKIKEHAMMLTDLRRQEKKLLRFVENCK